MQPSTPEVRTTLQTLAKLWPLGEEVKLVNGQGSQWCGRLLHLPKVVCKGWTPTYCFLAVNYGEVAARIQEWLTQQHTLFCYSQDTKNALQVVQTLKTVSKLDKCCNEWHLRKVKILERFVISHSFFRRADSSTYKDCLPDIHYLKQYLTKENAVNVLLEAVRIDNHIPMEACFEFISLTCPNLISECIDRLPPKNKWLLIEFLLKAQGQTTQQEVLNIFCQLVEKHKLKEQMASVCKVYGLRWPITLQTFSPWISAFFSKK